MTGSLTRFLRFAPNRTLSFQKEIDSLQDKLRDVDTWKQRLGQIEDELSFQK